MSSWLITMFPGAFPTLMSSAARWGQVEQAGHREPVVDDHLGRRQHLGATDGQQAGVARAGAHEVHGHRVSVGGSTVGRSVPIFHKRWPGRPGGTMVR